MNSNLVIGKFPWLTVVPFAFEMSAKLRGHRFCFNWDCIQTSSNQIARPWSLPQHLFDLKRQQSKLPMGWDGKRIWNALRNATSAADLLGLVSLNFDGCSSYQNDGCFFYQDQSTNPGTQKPSNSHLFCWSSCSPTKLGWFQPSSAWKQTWKHHLREKDGSKVQFRITIQKHVVLYSTYYSLLHVFYLFHFVSTIKIQAPQNSSSALRCAGQPQGPHLWDLSRLVPKQKLKAKGYEQRVKQLVKLQYEYK